MTVFTDQQLKHIQQYSNPTISEIIEIADYIEVDYMIIIDYFIKKESN